VEFNAINKAVNKLINIIHAKKFARSKDLIVDIIAVNIAIRQKNVLSFHVKLKYLLNVNAVIVKLLFFVA
jgi:hypothetical protein